jgi:hypothetical protein
MIAVTVTSHDQGLCHFLLVWVTINKVVTNQIHPPPFEIRAIVAFKEQYLTLTLIGFVVGEIKTCVRVSVSMSSCLFI